MGLQLFLWAVPNFWWICGRRSPKSTFSNCLLLPTTLFRPLGLKAKYEKVDFTTTNHTQILVLIFEDVKIDGSSKDTSRVGRARGGAPPGTPTRGVLEILVAKERSPCSIVNVAKQDCIFYPNPVCSMQVTDSWATSVVGPASLQIKFRIN